MKCKDCIRKYNQKRYQLNKDIVIKRTNEWTQKNPDKRKQIARKGRLKNKYKLTESQFEEMKQRANGICQICNNKPSRLVIDHDHVTGKVRGLICDNCNLGLGGFKDSVNSLKNAINYLEK